MQELPVPAQGPLRARDFVLKTAKGWIESGKLSAGAFFPPELELSRMLGVSRGTLRSALGTLEESGWLKTERGRGRVVCDMAKGGKPALLSGAVLMPLRHLDNPMEFANTGFIKAVEAGAYGELAARSRDVLSLHLGDKGAAEISRMLSLSPSGAILLEELFYCETGWELARKLCGSGIPIAVNFISEELSQADRVVSDAFSGAHMLTKFLLENGRRRILRLWKADPSRYWFSMRDRGHEKALAEAGLAPIPAAAPPQEAEHSARKASSKGGFEEMAKVFSGYLAESLLSDAPPDAIMTSTDWDVPLVAAACRILRKEPGKDVLICGYDSKWQESPWKGCDDAIPAATVNKNNCRIGQELVDVLLRRIAGSLPPEPQLIMVEPSLELN